MLIPFGFTTPALQGIWLDKEVKNFTFYPAVNFSKLLNRYLSGYGETKYLTDEEMFSIIFGQKRNKQHYSYNINQLKKAAEQTAMLNNSSTPIYISTTPDNNFKCTCYKAHNCIPHTMTIYDDSVAADWGYSIGESLCAMQAEVYTTESYYYMNVKYYLIDTYEFPTHWDATANTFFDIVGHGLHESGNAKEYKVIGVYEDFVKWEKGEIVYENDYIDITINTEAYDTPPLF